MKIVQEIENVKKQQYVEQLSKLQELKAVQSERGPPPHFKPYLESIISKQKEAIAKVLVHID